MHRRAVGFDRKAGHKTESDSSAASHPLRPCRRCVSSALRWKCRGGGSRRRRQRERWRSQRTGKRSASAASSTSLTSRDDSRRAGRWCRATFQATVDVRAAVDVRSRAQPVPPAAAAAVRICVTALRRKKWTHSESASQARGLPRREWARAETTRVHGKTPMRPTREDPRSTARAVNVYCTPRGQMRRARRDHASARVDPAEARATSIPVHYSCLFSPM